MFAIRNLARRCRCAALIGAAAASGVAAQTQYRNLDAGRPGRVEDAEVASRYSLDVDLAPFQVERLVGGTTRYRAEPKVGYGILPFTELELRAPVVQVNPPSGSGVRPVAGLAGLSIGLMRALNLETTSIPALALAGEVSLPVGSISATRPSFLLKALATRTTSLGRINLNIGAGTYAVRSASASDTTCSAFRFRAPGDTTCGGGPPIIIDVPCNVIPSQSGRLASANARACMPTLAESTTTVTPRVAGNRWLAGLGVDHTFPLHSTLITADVFAERFIGLYPKIDWTAEAGIRHQLTPVIVVDAGIGWRFAGTVRSTSATVGATYEFATPPFLGR